MKILTKIIVIVTVLFILSLSLAQPQIESQLSSLFGTNLKIVALRAQLYPQLSIAIEKVSVGKPGEEIELKDLEAEAQFLPLLSRKLAVTKLIVKEPVITFVKDASGLHVGGLAVKDSGKVLDEAKGSKKVIDKNSSPYGGSSPINIELKKLEIRSGTITFEDASSKTRNEIRNLNVDSEINVEGENVVFPSSDMRADLPSYQGHVKISSPKIIMNLATHAIDGSARIDDTRLKIGALELSDINSDLLFNHSSQNTAISSEKIKIIANGCEVSSALNASLSDKSFFEASRLEISFFDGMLSIPVKYDLSNKSFQTPFLLKNITIEKALECLQGGSSSLLYGQINSVSGTVRGNASHEMLRTLNGQCSFSFGKGGLRGVNLPGRVLKEVKNIPLVDGVLYSKIPARVQKFLDSEDTEYSSLVGNAGLREGTPLLQEVKLRGDFYTITLDGSVTADLSSDLKGSIVLSKEITDEIVAKNQGIKNMLNSNGTIEIPFTISGVLPKVQVVPDLSKLFRATGKKFLEDKAEKLINKAIGGKNGGALKSILGL